MGDLDACAISGDAVAYRRFRGSVTPLRALARRRVTRARLAVGDAEDGVQEVLLAIHLARGSPRSRNKFVDALRRRGSRADISIESVSDTLAAEENGLGRHALDCMLGQLNDRQRDIVGLVSMEGASARQTAGVSAIRSGGWIARALD